MDMKYSWILTLVLMLTLTLTACGAEAEAIPTINPMDLQGTVAAEAFTMIAETQAAIPTAGPADRYTHEYSPPHRYSTSRALLRSRNIYSDSQ
jgi:hypothetical protein